MSYLAHVNSIIILTLSFTLLGCAQQPPSSNSQTASPTPAEPPLAASSGPEKSVGKAKAFYSPKVDKIEATVDLDVIGKYESASEADYLEMLAYFNVPGRKIIQPESMHFVFTSRSRQLKYQVNHKLTISLDGTQFVSGDTKIVNSGCGPKDSCEEVIRSPELPYNQFLRMLEAREIEMRLGDTKFKLSRGNIEGLRDLSRIVES
jgi:hypothetical protein